MYYELLEQLCGTSKDENKTIIGLKSNKLKNTGGEKTDENKTIIGLKLV